MSKKVTIGGDRLGSGNKMQTELHNYARSTHNLSKDVTTTAAPGVLYPVYTNIALNGDTFDIDLDAAALTIPTMGPLFGTFKLQLDVFSAPIRLYNGILHNNSLNIGLKMAQVKFPMLSIPAKKQKVNIKEAPTQINDSALMKYLGLSGIGLGTTNCEDDNPGIPYMYRNINALPALSYYDIFKNYYANKQEKNAYVITAPDKFETAIVTISQMQYNNMQGVTTGWIEINEEEEISTTILLQKGASPTSTGIIEIQLENLQNWNTIYDGILITFVKDGQYFTNSLAYFENNGILKVYEEEQQEKITIEHGYNYSTFIGKNGYKYLSIQAKESPAGINDIRLVAFPLDNIDRMRNDILSINQLGQRLIISDEVHNYYPYGTLVRYNRTEDDEEVVTANQYVMNGLCVKTYQSDIFNNWVQTEWIDGENGINAITAVDTSAGNFHIDALILAKKIYDVLNRVAISGGTYEDWQEAVYTQNAVRKAETPIWHGGMSDEVVFEQIIQTTPTENLPLGNLGGKGTLLNHGRKGGEIRIKVTEPSIIMVIASLTPRIVQSQGNKWFLTNLDSMDDLHKPALDGIGFQELITEQMAWWENHFTTYNPVGVQPNMIHYSAGKIPAWLNYMTDYNEVYGEFADLTKRGYNVLARNYEFDTDEGYQGRIKDLTTYIDPAKFNYAFALARRDAQNFWLQIRLKVIARRLMSAKIIPNL